MLYAILKPIAVALMRLLFRLEIVSPGLVPATGPVLIVSNHVSVLDPPLVGGAAPRPLGVKLHHVLGDEDEGADEAIVLVAGVRDGREGAELAGEHRIAQQRLAEIVGGVAHMPVHAGNEGHAWHPARGYRGAAAGRTTGCDRDAGAHRRRECADRSRRP